MSLLTLQATESKSPATLCPKADQNALRAADLTVAHHTSHRSDLSHPG